MIGKRNNNRTGKHNPLKLYGMFFIAHIKLLLLHYLSY